MTVDLARRLANTMDALERLADAVAPILHEHPADEPTGDELEGAWVNANIKLHRAEDDLREYLATEQTTVREQTVEAYLRERSGLHQAGGSSQGTRSVHGA